MVESEPIDPLNIAEGNGKTAEADRRRYFEIARGSALECAAIQDVLVVGKALEEKESRERKVDLDRMAAMLSRLGKGAMPSRKSPQAMESIPISIAISIPMKQQPLTSSRRCAAGSRCQTFGVGREHGHV